MTPALVVMIATYESVLIAQSAENVGTVRTISCSAEPSEGGSREAARVVAAVGRVMPSNCPSKLSRVAGG